MTRLREEAVEVLYRYGQLVDRFNRTEFVGLFSEDAQIEGVAETTISPQDLCELLERRPETKEFEPHHELGDICIELGSGLANGTANVAYYHRSGRGKTLMSRARYEFQLARDDDRWRIHRWVVHTCANAP